MFKDLGDHSVQSKDLSELFRTRFGTDFISRKDKIALLQVLVVCSRKICLELCSSALNLEFLKVEGSLTALLYFHSLWWYFIPSPAQPTLHCVGVLHCPVTLCDLRQGFQKIDYLHQNGYSGCIHQAVQQ